MVKRTEQILKDIRTVNMRVDTLITAIIHNLKSTRKEIAERKEKGDLK